MSRRALPLLLLAAGLLLVALGLWRLPSPQSTAAEQCASSPTPALCRAMVRGAPERDLGARDAAPPPLDATPPRPLVAGLDALAAGSPTTAYRVCSGAAAEEGLDRAPALVCAGRAALALHWPARAAWLAQRSLELQDDAAAHVLLAEALEAQRDMKGARVEYLRALDLEPDNRAALDGLRRCGGTPPPRPDLTGERRAEQEVSLA